MELEKEKLKEMKEFLTNKRKESGFEWIVNKDSDSVGPRLAHYIMNDWKDLDWYADEDIAILLDGFRYSSTFEDTSRLFHALVYVSIYYIHDAYTKERVMAGVRRALGSMSSSNLKMLLLYKEAPERLQASISELLKERGNDGKKEKKSKVTRRSGKGDTAESRG